MEYDTEASQSIEVIFKKKLKKLSQYAGRGTELITVYIPPNTDRSSVMNQLTEEISQSSNIKSPTTRKNVQGALRKLINFLKQINFKIPKNGLVIFAGNISETEGRTEIKLFTIKPVRELKTKLYWCDSSFHLEPLKEMATPKKAYGMLTIDKNEATIATLVGKQYKIIGHFTSGYSGKFRAGGQCLSPDTLIMKENGEIIAIKEAHNPLMVVSENFNAEKTEYTPVIAKWENNKELFKIYTMYPKIEIKSSKDHLFFVRTEKGIEEKPLEEIREGDYLLMPDKINLEITEKQSIKFEPIIKQKWNMKKINIPKKLDENFARLLGYYLGDGSYEIDRISFSEERKEIADFYKKLIEKNLKIEAKIKHREKKGYYQTRVGSRILAQLFRQIFGEGDKTLEGVIPKIVLKSSDKILAKYIAGFFDAEGYVSSSRVAFGIHNEMLAKQTQFALLRLGIISSILEYDNRKNPYSDKTRYTLEISDTESMKRFRETANFASVEKQQKLNLLISKRSNRNKVRQIVVNGREIAKILRNSGVTTTRFKCPDFFVNKKQLSKEMFMKNILEKIENPELKKRLELYYNSNLIAAKISKIESVGTYKTVDIETKSHNFIANGLIVHNSAQRFERIREEEEHTFYKRISEKINQAFLKFGDDLQGIIIGGPGMTKQFFLDTGEIDHRLVKKIIGTIDTSYTDESGIRELVQKSEELLKDTDMMKERKIVNDFLAELAKEGLATYGEKEVMKALDLGQVEKLLVSEDIEWIVYKIKDLKTDKIEIVFDKDGKFSPHKYKGNTPIEVLEEVDFLDYMAEKAEETSSELIVVSNETPEGDQFYNGFGGLGAILRYKV